MIAAARPGQLLNTAEGGRGLTSAIASKSWDDPEYRSRQAEIQEDRKKYVANLWDDPVFRKKHSKWSSDNLNTMWRDPEYRAMRSASAKEKWQDPEFRAMKSKHNSEIAIINNARPEKKHQQRKLVSAQNTNQSSEFNERRVNGLRIAFQVRKLRCIHVEMQAAFARGV